MMAKILGIIWIALGLLWSAKPQLLRNRLTRKMNRKMRWTVYGFMLMFIFLLIGSIIKAQGLLPKVVGLIGIIIVIKGIRLITAKTSEKMSGWWAKRPLGFFRVWGLIILVAGILLVLA